MKMSIQFRKELNFIDSESSSNHRNNLILILYLLFNKRKRSFLISYFIITPKLMYLNLNNIQSYKLKLQAVWQYSIFQKLKTFQVEFLNAAKYIDKKKQLFRVLLKRLLSVSTLDFPRIFSFFIKISQK